MKKENKIPDKKSYHLYLTKNLITGERIEKIVASFNYNQISSYMYIGKAELNSDVLGGWMFYDGKFVVLRSSKLASNGDIYYIGEVDKLGSYSKFENMPEGQVKDAMKVVNSLDDVGTDKDSKTVDAAWDAMDKKENTMSPGLPKPPSIDDALWKRIQEDLRGMK